MLTFERAHERLIHDIESGELIWKIDFWKKVKAGCIAGDRYHNGYRRVCIDSKDYLAHRVVWLMTYGEWPAGEIDHINGIRDDNRIANLRLATSAQNKQNIGLRSNNKSGFQGVSWFVAAKKWRADIVKDHIQHYLGTFETPELAADFRELVKSHLHFFQPTSR